MRGRRLRRERGRCHPLRNRPVDGDGTNASVWGASTNAAGLTNIEAAKSFLVSGDDLAISAGQRLRIRFYSDEDVKSVGATTQTLWYAGTTPAASGDTYLTFTQTLTEFSSGPDVVPRGRIPQYAQHLAH